MGLPKLTLRIANSAVTDSFGGISSGLKVFSKVSFAEGVIRIDGVLDPSLYN